MKYIITITIVTIFFISKIFAQDSHLSGNVIIDAQTYKEDKLIGAEDVKEKILSNTHLNLFYRTGNFNFGMRYEAYLNPILGIDARYKGQGIAHRFANFTNEAVDVTVGDFYEQFGSGMILRAYQERNLGVDNAIEGARVKANPHAAIDLTVLIGKQRNFWGKSEGLLRAADININLNNIFYEPYSKDYDIIIGASAVSRYEQDLNPDLKLPENVFAYTLRAGLFTPSFILETEFAQKYNDPNVLNEYVYNDGYGVLVSASYFTAGLGINLNLHRLDNMDMRGERNAFGSDLYLNYVPPLTRQHAFRLPSMFPYSTQLKGQVGIQTEVTFSSLPGDFLSGKYGWNLSLNFSRINSIVKNRIDEYTYDSPFFEIGDETYFQDITIDFDKKITDKFKTNLMFVSQIYNRDIVEKDGLPYYGKLNINSVVLEGTYMLTNTHALRGELQHLWYKQDSVVKDPDNMNGNWAFAFLEYSISPKWFFSISDEYNYGNDDAARQLHYISGAITFALRSTRFMLGYGRQRGGVLCVGGVCRPVPASNGFTLSFYSSF